MNPFTPDRAALLAAVSAVFGAEGGGDLPELLPEHGAGSIAALQELAPLVMGQAQSLGGPTDFAHMDPPTPWVTWVTALWNASLNQNMLHPDLSPMATRIETRVIDWLAPYFGMDGGHMTAGSSISNLTAIWAAREIRGVKRVLASDAAHLSVAKAAHILGLEYVSLATDVQGRLDPAGLRGDLSDAVLVLTAGTTNAGAIDPLHLRGAWTHIDAAWAGPMRLSPDYAGRLAGVETADSVSVSAHKWLFQPKDSALVLFRDTKQAHQAVAFGGAYLSTPNIGVSGSRSAAAVPLMATLIALGRAGLAKHIDTCMSMADQLCAALAARGDITLFGPNSSGVVLWRRKDIGVVFDRMPKGSVSMTTIDGQRWFRNVAANPNADIGALIDAINKALGVGYAGEN